MSKDATTATPAVKPAKAAKTPKTPKVVVPKTPKDSKKSKAIPIVAAGIAAGTARKDILAKLKTELGLGDAGANTYYQNVKSGAWK